MIIQQTQPQLRSAYIGRVSYVPVTAAVYWLVLLISGADVIDATLLAISILFGLLAVGAAGGMKTAAGLLNFVMILKFVLIAVVLKAITLQAADSNLRAPRTTCKVMAVGFFAMYLGSLLYRHATKVNGVVRDVNDSKTYLALAIVFSAACLGSSLVLLIFQTSYATDLAGGFWGVAHQLQGATSFCVVPAMYYAWSSGSKRFLSHPLVVAILVLEMAFGIASTTKQGTMEPLLCYFAVGAIRYGLKSKVLWGLVAAGAFFYVAIVYPYSQYVRDHGGRDGSLADRLEVIKDVFFNVSTNSDYRSMVDSQISNGEFYLNRESLRPVSRLAMIGEADRLIEATDATQSYTGWETITNGLRLMVPSFLIADKPTSGGGNFLGHIAGDLATDDMTTQVSYGFMANFYNAFGMQGVLFGSILFIAIFHYVIRLWFATPYLELTPWGSTIWYVLLGMMFEHSLIEGPVGNMFPTFVDMSAIVGLVLLSRWVVGLFAPRYAPTGY